MFIATVIAIDSLCEKRLACLEEKIAAAGCRPHYIAWLDEGHAADIMFRHNPAAAQVALESCSILYKERGADQPFDFVIQPAHHRRKKLLIADMDSTMIQVETLDELADYVGIKPQIAAITERAMAGEIDFTTALIERVALLRGLPEQCIAACLVDRVVLTPGARLLVQTMKAHGARTVLVSGGFCCFADPVATEIGFDRVVANVLSIADGRLAGMIAEPIITGQSKLAVLQEESAALAADKIAVLAIGDGANDSAMLSAAGLGIGYHPHPIAARAADAVIRDHDLRALLWAQGWPRAEWVEEQEEPGG